MLTVDGVAGAVCFVVVRNLVRETQDGTRSHSEQVRPRVSGLQEVVTQGTRSGAACIVSFNPGSEARLTTCGVLSQVSTVFVIDSASDGESGLAPTRLCAEPGVAPMVNNENVGVTGAFNGWLAWR